MQGVHDTDTCDEPDTHYDRPLVVLLMPVPQPVEPGGGDITVSSARGSPAMHKPWASGRFRGQMSEGTMQRVAAYCHCRPWCRGDAAKGRTHRLSLGDRITAFQLRRRSLLPD